MNRVPTGTRKDTGGEFNFSAQNVANQRLKRASFLNSPAVSARMESRYIYIFIFSFFGSYNGSFITVAG